MIQTSLCHSLPYSTTFDHHNGACGFSLLSQSKLLWVGMHMSLSSYSVLVVLSRLVASSHMPRANIINIFGDLNYPVFQTHWVSNRKFKGNWKVESLTRSSTILKLGKAEVWPGQRILWISMIWLCLMSSFASLVERCIQNKPEKGIKWQGDPSKRTFSGTQCEHQKMRIIWGGQSERHWLNCRPIVYITMWCMLINSNTPLKSYNVTSHHHTGYVSKKNSSIYTW